MGLNNNHIRSNFNLGNRLVISRTHETITKYFYILPTKIIKPGCFIELFNFMNILWQMHYLDSFYLIFPSETLSDVNCVTKLKSSWPTLTVVLCFLRAKIYEFYFIQMILLKTAIKWTKKFLKIEKIYEK